MLKNIPFNKYTVFALVWFVVCWFGILKESSGSAPPFPHFDKAAHCGMFFAQIWLIARSFLEARRRPPYAALLVFALVFALSSELAQLWFTQTRSAELADGLADMLGTGLALLLARNVAAIKGVG
ncbi:VanZ family protein [Neisseria sp. 83E34]|uniref:VanZ family protein n=1 Tax=Neisseria sp. 83E34 TaxID=1692264 RepID=UPI0006CE8897|nr:VanZ family protein [Neisseria sp. 83E34]KPN71491.1 VanZ family protein [Neisseria sp. 83E34]